ncbi:MAG: MotA/TolQ/ExbB proton channel family protein [Deltaproteobacteria bacterium]|nr:MotA/TolQ/ExbB proton channel family protein [Deltaproteobacteria bacterium]
MNISLWEAIKIGGVTMWVILGCSVVSLAVTLERLVALWSYLDRARGLAETVNRCLFRGAIAEARAACERSHSPLADVFLVGFERLGRGSTEALVGAVDRERHRVTLDLKSRLWILGTVGAASPFIGLFGTVVGIMGASHSISQQQAGAFSVVYRGISEALIATAAGILVAVVAVVLYNYFMQRLARIAVELKLLVDEFLEVLKEKGQDGARQATG